MYNYHLKQEVLFLSVMTFTTTRTDFKGKHEFDAAQLRNKDWIHWQADSFDETFQFFAQRTDILQIEICDWMCSFSNKNEA